MHRHDSVDDNAVQLIVLKFLSTIIQYPCFYSSFSLTVCVQYCLMISESFCVISEVVVSPPFVFLPKVKGILRPDFQVAAQNCWVRKGGAFTGEVRYVHI